MGERMSLTKTLVLTFSCWLLAARAHAGAPQLFQQSYDAEAAGRFADAVAALDQLPPAERDAYVAELRRGWLLYCAGRNADAIAAYTRASALAPRAVEPRVGILLPLVAERRFAEVEKHAREVLRVDPGNYSASLRLAFAQFSLGRYEEALAGYRRLVDWYPGDLDARSGLGWTLARLNRVADAAVQFHAVLAVAPQHRLARDGLKLVEAKTQ
jgi:tetratricopeptide (TPR) repeat protein